MIKDMIKNYDVLDMALIMLSSLVLGFFIITVPNPANNVVMEWVHSVHWGWFLAAAIILVLRPKIRAWKK